MTYLPTTAISTGSAPACTRSTSPSTPRGRAPPSIPRWSDEQPVEPLVVQHERHLVDRRDVGRARRRRAIGTSHSSEIFSLRFRPIGRSDLQTIASGCRPSARSSFTECCVGLVFSSPEGPMNGIKRHVHERAVRSRPTSLRSWRIASRNGKDSMSPTVPPISTICTSACSVSASASIARLDLVGDVRDHLHRLAQVVAASLLREDRGVDGAGGEVRPPVQVGVEEPLVVAEVQVGLGAVVQDEHLAVLERVHRARIDVDVRVELLQDDLRARGIRRGGRGRRW